MIMTLQNRPLVKRSNTIRDSEVPKYVGKLKRFLGHGALSQAQLDLDRELSHHGRVYRYWAQELRPWLFALRNYDQITSNGMWIACRWFHSKQPPEHSVSRKTCRMANGIGSQSTAIIDFGLECSLRRSSGNRWNQRFRTARIVFSRRQ